LTGKPTLVEEIMTTAPRYPGIRVTANGNQLVSYHTETRIADAGVFYPITPSTELGELYQQSYAEGRLNVFGGSTLAVEAEGEHAAQGGAIAHSVCGKRVVNFTSGQGILYGVEQYYHAPGKCSTMVLEVVARALTKHALNVHCGHDDVYGAEEVSRYTVAHWCLTEARFRNHFKKIKKDQAEKLISLENMLVRITQQDVVYRRYLLPEHRSYVPDFGVYIKVPGAKGDVEYRAISRQLVLFSV